LSLIVIDIIKNYIYVIAVNIIFMTL